MSKNIEKILTREHIEKTVIKVLKEELPNYAKATMKMAKQPQSVLVDLRNDAISSFLSSIADMENAFSIMKMALEKIQSEYDINDAAKDGYPFDSSPDEMYKKVIHWVAAQTEMLTNRYLNVAS